MTRFWITIEEASRFVCESFEIMNGGELYVPRIPSMKLVDLASAVAPSAKFIETGIRPGEKLHEEMISADDSRRTVFDGSRYIVNPVVAEWGYKEPEGKKLSEDNPYRSNTNDLWLTADEIRTFIAQHQH
jgi:UDP-N-acetylglucosamine 4,6-dehydratase